MEEITIDRLYASGELSLKELDKIQSKFHISCAACGSQDVRIFTEGGGGCETCGPDPYEALLKCPKCGNAITIVM